MSEIKYKLNDFTRGDDWHLVIPFTLKNPDGSVISPEGYTVISKLFDAEDNEISAFQCSIEKNSDGSYVLHHKAPSSQTSQWKLGNMKFNFFIKSPRGEGKSSPAIGVKIVKKLS